MSINTVSSSHLPERALLILLELENGPIQVATLKRKIEQAYALPIEPGAFYKTLTSLERKGWIELAAIGTSPHPHAYCLTERGRATLHQQRALASHRRERILTTDRATSLGGGIMKLATWLVKLYPRAWRERYEIEMLALLEDHQITLITIFDLLFGVVDARLDPHYKTERALFAFKSPRAAVLTFFAALAAFLFLAQGNITVIAQGALVLFGSGQKVVHQWDGTSIVINGSATTLMTCLMYGLLFLIAMLTAFILVRRSIVAQGRKILLFAVSCFTAPFVLTPFLYSSYLAFHSSSDAYMNTSYALMIWGGLLIWGGLELLMGVLFLSILKSKQAIAARTKGLLSLVLIAALPVLRGASLLLPSLDTYSQQNLLSISTGLIIGVSPFAAISMLLLALVGSRFGEWSKRLTFATVGSVILIMTVYLLLFLIGSWSLWVQQVSIWMMQGPALTLSYGRIPIGFAGLGLLFSTLLALAASRSLLLALKNRTPVAQEAIQELPPMEMRQ